MKKISFRQYLDIQARFLIFKQTCTGLDLVFLAFMYADKLSNKLNKKYKVMR